MTGLPKLLIWSSILFTLNLSAGEDTCQLFADASLRSDCQRNSQCTGFHCTGKLGSITGLGVEVSPCNEVPQLTIFITMNDTISKTFNITNTLSVYNLSVPVNLAALGNGEVTLHVGFKTVNEQLVSKIKIQINASVSQNGQKQQFENVLNFTSGPLQKCVLPKPTLPPNETVTDFRCVVGKMHQCNSSQLCRQVSASNLREGRCVCVHDTAWDKNAGECVSVIPSPLPSSSSSDSQNVIVIIVCSLLGVLVVAAVMAIIVKYRRYKQRYGQHELLINNEGTDRDLDGDSPMLDG